MSTLKKHLRVAVLIGFLLAIFTMVVGSNVTAAASENFTADASGITLPAGQTFPDGGHVNIQSDAPHHDLHFEAKCVTRTDAECAGDLHDAAQYIGQSFIPWSAFGLVDSFCVPWIQVAGFNYHFSDNGEAPICSGGTPSTSVPTPTATTPAPPTPTSPPTPTTSTPPATESPSPSPTPSETHTPTSTPKPTSPATTPSPSTTPAPVPSTTPPVPTAITDGGSLTSSADRSAPAPARLADTGLVQDRVAAVFILAGSLILFGCLAWIIVVMIRDKSAHG